MITKCIICIIGQIGLGTLIWCQRDGFEQRVTDTISAPSFPNQRFDRFTLSPACINAPTLRGEQRDGECNPISPPTLLLGHFWKVSSAEALATDSELNDDAVLANLPIETLSALFILHKTTNANFKSGILALGKCNKMTFHKKTAT